jgi:hypothetical protein
VTYGCEVIAAPVRPVWRLSYLRPFVAKSARGISDIARRATEPLAECSVEMRQVVKAEVVRDAQDRHMGSPRQRLVMGDQVVVDKGLNSGDKVITGNLQKIGPGMPVQELPPEQGAS